jgi:hypothetical protein
MPFSFPSSPSVNQQSQQNGRTYSWSGSAWELVAATGVADSRWDLFLPAAPTSVAATGDNGQATVSWTAPTGVISQAPITDYTVQYSSNSGSSWTTFTRAASTATSVIVTGLANSTAYVFRVAAVNGVGTGSYSTASNSVTPGEVDPLFSSVKMLLHFDGSDGSTSFVDSSSSAIAITKHGNAAISTAQSRFGGASGRLASAGDYLTFSGATDIGTGNFCIEFFIYSGWSGDQMIFDFRNVTQLALWTSGTGLLLFNSGNFAVRAQMTPNTWQHVALARTGSTIRLFVGGALAYSASDANYFSRATGFIGKPYDANWSQTNFWIDEMRVTIGSDRGYTGSTITVPTQAFLNA